MAAKLFEYHTGCRAFSRALLEQLPLDANSDDFVFDNQMLAQILWLGQPIGEVSCPTKYFPEASSINLRAQHPLRLRLPRHRVARSASPGCACGAPASSRRRT